MGFSNIVQGVMEVAGAIPAVGMANAKGVGAAAKGDGINASLCATAAVPSIGDVAEAAGVSKKLAANGTKILENGSAKAKKMAALFGGLAGKAKTGAKKAKGKASRKKKEKKAKKAAKQECTHGSCFTGDTLVCTRRGFCPIKEIQTGDEVSSRNIQTGETGFCKVQKTFQTTAHTIHQIFLDGNEELKVTAYHPVYVKGKGWVNAISLREGDFLETMDGAVLVTKIKKTRHDKPVDVYNFHVGEFASYFVSRLRVFVHNTECGKNGKYQPPKITTNKRGELTNGKYTLDAKGMEPHVNGTEGKSQFLNRVNEKKATLDAAAYADEKGLWSKTNPSKAKVFVEDGPVGVTSSGKLTSYINVYRTKSGYVHGCPGNP